MEKKGRRKKGLWMYEHPHRWSAHNDGRPFVSQNVCVRASVCLVTHARSSNVHSYVHSQMLAHTWELLTC